jgi:hypothetical protein
MPGVSKASNRQVLIHKRWRTVHELDGDQTLCGNGKPPWSRFRKVPASTVKPGDHPMRELRPSHREAQDCEQSSTGEASRTGQKTRMTRERDAR